MAFSFDCMSFNLSDLLLIPNPFRFSLGVWSPCSEPCGGGQQHRNLTCVQVVSKDVTKILPESECAHLLSPLRKQTCNNLDCLQEWIIGEWTQVWHNYVMFLLISPFSESIHQLKVVL